MNTGKSLQIRLNDIWADCQKELIVLQTKCKALTDSLKTSEQINRRLTKCNETLVTIIEKCNVDDKHNEKVRVLIKIIKDEEECIEKEKQSLSKFKEQVRCSVDNNNRISKLTSQWNQCYQIKKPDNSSKSCQTSDNYLVADNSINLDLEYLDNNDQIKDEQIDQLESFNQAFSLDCGANTFDSLLTSDPNEDQIVQQIDYQFDEMTNETTITKRDEDIESDVSYDLDQNDSFDSDNEEVKRPRRSSRKRRRISSKNVSKNTQRINEVITPFLKGDNYICAQIGCAFKSNVKKVFYSHYVNHNKIFRCDRRGCDFKTLKQTELTSHIDETHDKNDNLNDNQRRIIRVKNRVKPYFSNGDYLCDDPTCEFISRRRALFYKHLLKHDREKGLIPDKEVIKKANNSERPYVCDWPDCGKAFRQADHYKLHRKRHTGQRDYPCDWPGCDAKFYTTYLFKVHRRIHTGERPLNCEWPGCTCSFKQKWALVAHKRTHTGEKPYACLYPSCGYRCNQSCTLISHNRKHTGEKPYKCPFQGCDKHFATLAGVWAHKKAHQRKEFVASKQKPTKTRPKRYEIQTESVVPDP